MERCEGRHALGDVAGRKRRRDYTTHHFLHLDSSSSSASSSTHSSYLSSFSVSPTTLLFLCCLISMIHTSSSAVPAVCNMPPPSHNCGSFRFAGEGFYYNSSSPQRPCLSWIDWGCPGGHLFDSLQECLDACHVNESSSSSSVPVVTSSTPPAHSSSSSSFVHNPTPTPAVEVTDPPGPPTHPPEFVCRISFRNYPCNDLSKIYVWIYDWDRQRCFQQYFFHRCVDRTENMYTSEQDCIRMCGRFSPHYPSAESPISPSSSSSQSPPSTPLRTTVPVALPPLPVSPTPTHESTVPTVNTFSTEVTREPSEETKPPTTTDGSSTSTFSTSSTSSSSLETDPTSPEVDSNLRLEQEGVELTAFDMASIGVGVLIIVLISLMIIVLVTFVYRRRRLMMGRQETTRIKSATNPCKPLTVSNSRGNGIHFTNDDVAYSSSPSTSSSYCV